MSQESLKNGLKNLLLIKLEENDSKIIALLFKLHEKIFRIRKKNGSQNFWTIKIYNEKYEKCSLTEKSTRKC